MSKVNNNQYLKNQNIKSNLVRFSLLDLNNPLTVVGGSAIGGALWGLGYGLVKPPLEGEDINKKSLMQEVAANTVAGALSGSGIYYGGRLLNKIRVPKFSMHYMNADFKL